MNDEFYKGKRADVARSFSDLITPRSDGGVDILVDHPAGPMRWELPGERAYQLVAALQSARSDACADLDTRLRSYIEPADSEIAAPRDSVSGLKREVGRHRDTLRALRVMLDPQGCGIGWPDGKVLLAVRDMCDRDAELTAFRVAVCREVGVGSADRSGDEHAAVAGIRDLRDRVLRAETSAEEWERRLDTALYDVGEMQAAWEDAEQENKALRDGLREALDNWMAWADGRYWLDPRRTISHGDRINVLRKLLAGDADGG